MPSSKSDKARPLLSLFSGAGGLDRGFEDAGFRTALALDNDPAAVETHNWNRPFPVARQADLARVTPDQILESWRREAHDTRGPAGIVGGPPCQAFSVSNVHKLEDDSRATLPLAYARILDLFNREFGLDFFVFENVAGLGHRPHGSSLSMFLEAFAEAGFDVKPYYLDAVRFGVPQLRKRMFVVGFNRKLEMPEVFTPPAGNAERHTVREAIGDLVAPAFFSRSSRPEERGLHPNHWCLNPRSKKFQNGTLRSGEMISRSFRMLDWDQPSWTVAYGHREVHVHPDGKRRLSVLEAMLLQGFPPSYQLRGSLSDQIRLVSDAVPPPLAHALAVSIQEFLAGSTSRRKTQVSANGHSSHNGRRGVQTASPKSTIA